MCWSAFKKAFQRAAPCLPSVCWAVFPSWPGWCMSQVAHRPPAGSFCLGWHRLIPGHPHCLTPASISAASFYQHWCLFLSGSSFHSSFSWSVPVFIPRVLPPLVLSFSNPQSCIAPYSPASPFSVLKLILSFLPSSAHWSAYSSCFSQPQNSFSLSATLLSLHLNQLLSLSFVNTRGRRGRKRSLKRR